MKETTLPAVRALSSGPRHHFYGYFGFCPWDRMGGRHLALKTDFQNRRPRPEDVATVGFIEAATGDFVPMAEMRAFNLQQGSMMHWIGKGRDREFTYNDWEGDQLVTRVVNPETDAQRTLAKALTVPHPGSNYGIGLNFARMASCRPVVGYANEAVPVPPPETAPEDDGLWHIDLRDGSAKLLVSHSDIHRRLPAHNGAPEWFNHVVYGPSGEGVVFLSRYYHEGKLCDALWLMTPDGKGLRNLIPYPHRVSHFCWLDDETLMLSTTVLGEMQFCRLNVWSGSIEPYNLPGFPADGHNTLSPDGRWLACDTYPDSDRLAHLYVHDFETETTHEVGAFYHPPEITGDHRCDLHPRWSDDSRTLTFDSVHEGTRQIYAFQTEGFFS